MRRLFPLVALLGAAPLAAQQPLVSRTLDSGTVVRLLLRGGSASQGMLLAPLTPDAQRVVFSPPTHRECGVPQAVCRVHVPVSDVHTMEVRRGSRAGRGALIGALAGGFVGVGLTQTWPCGRVADGCAPSPHGARVIVVTTLVLGAGIGTLVGLGFPAWERAP